MQTDQNSVLQVTANAGWTEIRLNRAQKRNAISSTMVTELASALDQSVSDGRRVVLLCANGPIFCAGADLADRGEPGRSPSLMLVQALLQTRAFVIAEVEQPALGAGVAAIAACSSVVDRKSVV